MATTVTKEFNNSGQSHGGTLRVPYELMKVFKGINLLVASVAFSFAGKNNRAVSLKQNKVAARYNVSLRSANRSVKHVTENGAIERDGGVSKYKFKFKLKKVNGKELYCAVEDWLRHAVFTYEGKTIYTGKKVQKVLIEKGKVYLTNAEILVLSYLISLCREAAGAALYRGSNECMAKRLHISKTTVGKAITRLAALNLITTSGKARNNYVRTVYTVQKDVLERARKETVRYEKGNSQAAQDADFAAQRERYYAQNRHAAEERARHMMERANIDAEYYTANMDKKHYEIEIAKAMAGGRSTKELQRKLAAAERIRSKCLAALGMTEEDLLPHYTCERCADTGTLPSGYACSCYPGRGRR